MFGNVFEDFIASGDEGGTDDEFEGDVDDGWHSIKCLIGCFVYGAKVAGLDWYRNWFRRMYCHNLNLAAGRKEDGDDDLNNEVSELATRGVVRVEDDVGVVVGKHSIKCYWLVSLFSSGCKDSWS